jgi:hypothetical protein
VPELLPPKRAIAAVTPPSPSFFTSLRQAPPAQQTAFFLFTAGFVCSASMFALGQFFQTRGVQSMLTSRIFLYAAFLFPVLLLWNIAVIRKTRRAIWIASVATILLAVVAYAMDKAFPMPTRPEEAKLSMGKISPASVDVQPTQIPPQPKAPPRTAKQDTGYDQCKAVFLGVVHPTTEAPIYLPPNSEVVIAAGKPTAEAVKHRRTKDRDAQIARCRLKYKPGDLTLLDLFYTDFATLGGNTAVEYGFFSVTNNQTEVETPIGYAIIKQLETASKFIAFYIRYSNETPVITQMLATKYEEYLNSDAGERFTAKVPGDSAEMDSRDLVFSKRIYIYAEANFSPDDTVRVQHAYQNQVISVLIRSTDYLAMRKLQAQVAKK